MKMRILLLGCLIVGGSLVAIVSNSIGKDKVYIKTDNGQHLNVEMLETEDFNFTPGGIFNILNVSL